MSLCIFLPCGTSWLVVAAAKTADPILLYTWRNAMSLGVYFSLVAQAAGSS
jgi:hypothetical protein